MQRFTSVLAGAAVSLAMAASAPAQATSLRPMPAVLTDDGPSASIQTVHDTRWRHRHRDRGPHFSFGFAAPFVPFAYPHVYTTTRFADGYYWSGAWPTATTTAIRITGPRPGDVDGVVVIPAELAARTIELALEKVLAENTVREELAAGEKLADVFARHGIL